MTEYEKKERQRYFRGELSYIAFTRTTQNVEVPFEKLPKLEQIAWINAARIVTDDLAKEMRG